MGEKHVYQWKEFNGKGKFNNFPNYLIELHRKNVRSGFKAACLRFAPSVCPFLVPVRNLRVILFFLCSLVSPVDFISQIAFLPFCFPVLPCQCWRKFFKWAQYFYRAAAHWLREYERSLAPVCWTWDRFHLSLLPVFTGGSSFMWTLPWRPCSCCCQVASVVSQPTRLSCPWDSPGKNTGVGCQSESEVAQSCPTLSDPMDYSLPGSFVHGIFQARVLEWGAIA